MTIVLNNTVRPITIKAMPVEAARNTKANQTLGEMKSCIKVSLKPGFNEVEDNQWALVSQTEYAKILQEYRHIEVSKAGSEKKDKIDREADVAINEPVR